MKVITKTPIQLIKGDKLIFNKKKYTVSGCVLNPYTGQYIITYCHDKFSSHAMFCKADEQLNVQE